jgi:hypothetical protein
MRRETSASTGVKRGHPTHHLEENITVEWLGVKKSLQLGKIPTAKPRGAPPPACYPSKETCQTLVWQNLFFALTNGDFSLLMGAIYWLCGIVIAFRDRGDVYLGIAAVLGWAIIGYTKNQEKPKGWKKALPVFISSAAHAPRSSSLRGTSRAGTRPILCFRATGIDAKRELRLDRSNKHGERLRATS